MSWTTPIVQLTHNAARLHHSFRLQALASNLLGRAKDLASNEDLSSDVSFQLSLALASEQIKRAEQLLSTPEAEGNADAGEAVGLLNTANEVIANLSAEDNDPATESKEAAANQMQAQVPLAEHQFLHCSCMWLTRLLLAALPIAVQHHAAGTSMAMVVWRMMQTCDAQNADCTANAT